eukprot:GEMP01038551.1.p1 GENE.GEMP01038551.1~~GEMP01038551.1.p1  ORF type:complete len:233 (+),score=49.54 GEMP01038551.1:347-1045(+)
MATPASLTLKIECGETPMTMSVEPNITGRMLKMKLQYTLKMLPEEQRLEFHNVEEDAPREIKDNVTLANQGFTENTKVRLLSALRSNICEKGDMSYYYAHKKDLGLAPEQRYVYGGEPEKIGQTDAVQLAPVVAIIKYAWSDEGENIKIYITAEDEGLAIAAAQDKEAIKFECEENRVSMQITSEKARYVFRLGNLERPIVPAESKYRVSGKKVSITLKKVSNIRWSSLIRK